VRLEETVSGGIRWPPNRAGRETEAIRLKAESLWSMVKSRGGISLNEGPRPITRLFLRFATSMGLSGLVDAMGVLDGNQPQGINWNATEHTLVLVPRVLLALRVPSFWSGQRTGSGRPRNLRSYYLVCPTW
jgi:hypothetical protein